MKLDGVEIKMYQLLAFSILVFILGYSAGAKIGFETAANKCSYEGK